MYLRTTRRKRSDGSYVTYYQLAHNVRHPQTGHTTAEIIHNFGRADQLDKDELVRLCHSIARVCNLEVHDPLSADADRSQNWPEDATIVLTRQLGVVWAVEALWEKLAIGPTIRRCQKQAGRGPEYERALFAIVANRLCEPESKLGVWQRWLKKVHLPSCWNLELRHMYEAMDLFHEHAEQVEKAVFFQSAELFNLQVDVVFYDTTTASFSIDYEDPDVSPEEQQTEAQQPALRKRGRSKDGTWSPQVVVALAVTSEGIPIRSWVFPGNTTDVTTVEKVKADLRGWKIGRCLFVADAGMNSEDNREQLSRACGKYLLAVRVGAIKEVKQQVLSHRGRYTKLADNLHAKEVIVGEGVRRRKYILCLNPHEAKRQKLHRQEVLAQLRDELAQHPLREAKAKWAMKLLTSQRTSRYLSVAKDGNVYLDQDKVKQVARLDGKWVLITNDDSLSVEDVACGYKGLQVIERCFRSLKSSQIKMAPMHHRLARRIETHVKLCVLALLIERIAEKGCSRPWSRIREELAQLQATEVHHAQKVLFRRNQGCGSALQTLKTLKIPPPKLVFDISELPT